MVMAASGQMHAGTSLLHGWLPSAIYVVSVLVLLAAIGFRPWRWFATWGVAVAAVGIAIALIARWYSNSQGMTGDEPAPLSLWLWIGIAGTACAVALLGWRRVGWTRRGLAVLAIPLCIASAAVSLNQWVGYFSTAQMAWSQVTDGPLPDHTDMSTALTMRSHHDVPTHGELVAITSPSTASHFHHRTEYVYLPPAWFASTTVSLPAVMMIGGEFATPADWPRVGDAIGIIDRFAAAHAGDAPVFVFADTGDSFTTDTECVDGPRGNVADHLTEDLPAYVESTFGVSRNPDNWGVVGWSMGGTCAVDVTVMNPDLFHSFVDIAGDIGPNAGTKQQTIDRLYAGNAAQWNRFDPRTVMRAHGPYSGVAGWFAVATGTAPSPSATATATGGAAAGSSVAAGTRGLTKQSQAARELCAAGSAQGIDCAVEPMPGVHNWAFATRVFRRSLPWVAGRVHTPDVAAEALPSAAHPAPL